MRPARRSPRPHRSRSRPPPHRRSFGSALRTARRTSSRARCCRCDSAESMDRRATKSAWVVTADGKPVAGKVSFAEDDTVLVFRPRRATAVRGGGRDARGGFGPVGNRCAARGRQSVKVRVEPKPAPPAPRHRDSGGGSSSGGSSGGNSVGGGSWAAVETYYLRLMNCTRTGGLVTSSGSCSSPGGRSVAALWIDSGISSKVSRPYAKRLAVNNQCSHFIGGNPGDRLRAAGYTATSGPRTSVAAPAIRVPPSWAHTCSSRASARTTAATT